MKNNLFKYLILMGVFLGVPSNDISAKSVGAQNDAEIKAITPSNRFIAGKVLSEQGSVSSHEKYVGGASSSSNAYDNTIYQTDYFETLYFNNLDENIGINTHGSCGYVASAALLSFFDTYWDDNIIEEKYEKSENFTSEYGTRYKSPGIINEPWESGSLQLTSPYDFDQYLRNIQNYKNSYFHFFLMNQAYNLRLRVPLDPDNFNWNNYTEDELYDGFDMYSDGPSKLLNWYLHTYRGYTNSQVEVKLYDSNFAPRDARTFDDSYYRQVAIENIQKGNPVIIGMYDYYGSGHYVVAYDYDPSTGRIFFNNLMQGLQYTHPHIGVNNLSWKGIANVTVVNFKTSHSHSNNYTAGSSTRCSCGFCVPQNIRVRTYIDKPATVYWDSKFAREKWFSDNPNSIYFQVNIASSVNVNATPLASGITSWNQYTLSEAQSKAFSSYSQVYVWVGLSTYSDPNLWKTMSSMITEYRPQINNSNFTNTSNKYVKLTKGSKSGSTWTVTVKNNTIFNLTLYYNKKMCFYNDGINWSGLSDVTSTTISPFSTTTIKVTTNWFADSIAVSHTFNGLTSTRYITVAKNPSNGSLSNYTSTK